MIVSRLIILHDSFLDTLGCHIQCNVYLPVFFTPFRGQNTKLYRIKCTSCIPVRLYQPENPAHLHQSLRGSCPFLFPHHRLLAAISFLISSFFSGFSSKILEREISAPFTSKYGFSVVAPIRMIVPSSTNGSR